MDEVERALAVLQDAQEGARRAAQVNHVRNHQALAQEMAERIDRLSVARQEFFDRAGAGRAGPPVEFLSQDELDERKKRILQQGGFRV